MSAPHTSAVDGTLLGIWAHPDDEIFLSAGLMALTRRAGHRVVCVTATAGDAGTDRPDLWPPDRLASVRLREQREALAVLGVHEVINLGYPDGGCAEVDAAQAVRPIAHVLRAVRPVAVVTFGPDGLSGHPDHIAVGGWARSAVTAAAPGTTVLEAVVTPAFVERQKPVNERLGAFGTGLPTPVEPSELALSLDLDDDLLDLKLAALRAHASQTRSQEALVGTERYRRWFETECFATPGAGPGQSLPQPIAA